jgi:hypothetical protein
MPLRPYGQRHSRGQVSRFIYRVRGISATRRSVLHRPGKEFVMVGGIAIAMFVALVGFGGKYFGWSDPDGKVQLALVTAFILGIIGGFKSRG